MCRPRICLLVLIGLPAAGKTHISSRLLRDSSRRFNVVHLCYDRFMEFPSSDALPENSYKTQRTKMLTILEELVMTIQTDRTLPNGLENKVPHAIAEACLDYVIICDDNNYYASMRYKLYQLCRRHELSYAQLYLDCPLFVCRQRNARRVGPHRVPENILLQMSQRLEVPNSTHSWEANSMNLSLGHGCVPFEDISRFLENSFDKVVTGSVTNGPIEMESVQSVVHQVDLLLRQRLRDQLGSNGGECKATRAKRLNDKRKEILDAVRQRLCTGTLSSEQIDHFVGLLS